MKKILKGQQGFTLIELLTVAAIMAVLSAIVFPAVTGTTSTSRESTQSVDINAVQTGVDRWNSDFSDWPTSAQLNGGPLASLLPTGDTSGSGTSSSTPILFTEDDLSPINFSDLDAFTGTEFIPDLMRNAPDHATDADITLTSVDADLDFLIKRGGDDLYIRLVAPVAGSVDFPVWGVDADGKAWVFFDADSY